MSLQEYLIRGTALNHLLDNGEIEQCNMFTLWVLLFIIRFGEYPFPLFADKSVDPFYYFIANKDYINFVRHHPAMTDIPDNKIPLDFLELCFSYMSEEADKRPSLEDLLNKREVLQLPESGSPSLLNLFDSLHLNLLH
jgi:hypothetical protein